MIDLKLKNGKDKKATMLDDEVTPEYPWGLRVTLENEQLEALGMTVLPQVDSVMTFSASARVTNQSITSNQNGDERMVTLQIEKMEISKGENRKQQPEVTMYGE
jgi:hypothetical protein